jgi:hypothetical protein
MYDPRFLNDLAVSDSAPIVNSPKGLSLTSPSGLPKDHPFGLPISTPILPILSVSDATMRVPKEREAIMIHPMTIEGPSNRVSVTCDVCGKIATNTTDKGADIAIAQHDARWTR